MTDASQEPAPDGSVFQFETKPLLALTAAEQGRLRELTLGTPGAYMLPASANVRAGPKRPRVRHPLSWSRRLQARCGGG